MQDIFKTTKNQLNRHVLGINQPFSAFPMWKMETVRTYPPLRNTLLFRVFMLILVILLVKVLML